MEKRRRRVRKKRKRKRHPLILALYVAEMWCTACEREVWEVFWLLKKLRVAAEKRWMGGVEL